MNQKPKWIPTKKDYQELGGMFLLSLALTIFLIVMGIKSTLSPVPLLGILPLLFSVAFTFVTTQGYDIIFHKLKPEERQLCWSFLPKPQRRRQ